MGMFYVNKYYEIDAKEMLRKKCNFMTLSHVYVEIY